MDERQYSDKLRRVKNKLPQEYRDHYVYGLDPHLVDILHDPDPIFVSRVKGYLERHVRQDAATFGYSKWVLIPRFGRAEVLLSGTV